MLGQKNGQTDQTPYRYIVWTHPHFYTDLRRYTPPTKLLVTVEVRG